MSDLQIGLILLGIALILALVVFNWWQDRRVRARMREHFPDDQTDALLAGRQQGHERREPGLGGVAPARAEGEPDTTDDDAGEVDAQLEAVIDIAFAHAVEADALGQALQSFIRVGNKPIRIFAERDGGGHRARLRAGESYVSLQLAVLLANRSGALNAIEWSQLWTNAQALATRFDGAIEGLEQDDVVRRAAELDTFCAAHDVTVNLGVRPAGPRPLADMQRVARDVGFLPHGRQLAWMAENGQPRFVLLFNGGAAQDVQSASVDRLDLVLDLPNSQADAQAFSRMAGVGRDLAGRLDAVLLDDQGRPVAPDADAIIDQQLAEIQQRLTQAGLVPGESSRTARVFS